MIIELTPENAAALGAKVLPTFGATPLALALGIRGVTNRYTLEETSGPFGAGRETRTGQTSRIIPAHSWRTMHRYLTCPHPPHKRSRGTWGFLKP
jgi:hypothetical protein